MSQVIKVKLEDLVHAPINLMARPLPDPKDKDYEEIMSGWAKSIRSQGLLNLFSVRSTGEGKFMTVDGNTRLFVINNTPDLKEMFADGVNVQVVEKSDIDALASSIGANANHRMTKPAHYAASLHKMMAYGGMTLIEVSNLTGMATQTIEKYLDLLKLPEPVKAMLDAGSMTLNNATQLAKLTLEEQNDPEWLQKAASMDGAAFSGEITKELEAYKSDKKAKKDGKAPEFSHQAQLIKKEKLIEKYELAKQAFENDPSDYNRIRKEVYDEIFQMDEASVRKAKEEWEASLKNAAEKKEQRAKKVAGEKALEGLLIAKQQGLDVPKEKIDAIVASSGIDPESKNVKEILDLLKA